MAAAVKEKPVDAKNYNGFVGGIFSGIAKLSGEQKRVFLIRHIQGNHVTRPSPELIHTSSFH